MSKKTQIEKRLDDVLCLEGGVNRKKDWHKGKEGEERDKEESVLLYCALLLACATPTNHKRQASARMNEGFEDETDTHTQQHKQH
jgi:hypothetical protein